MDPLQIGERGVLCVTHCDNLHNLRTSETHRQRHIKLGLNAFFRRLEYNPLVQIYLFLTPPVN